MSIKQQPSKALNKEQAMELFELLIALDHHRVDIKHAMEKAWNSEDYSQVHAYLLSAKETLDKACNLLPEHSAH